MKHILILTTGGTIASVQSPDGLVPGITSEQLRKAFAIIGDAMDDFKAGLIPDDVLQYRAGW